MKTNQQMLVKIGSHTLPIEHKTMVGSLTDVWKIGNSYRIEKGLSPLDLSHFLRSPETLEFVDVLEQDLGIVKKSKSAESAYLKKGTVPTIKSPLIKTKRGKGGGTWAHLYILLDAAGRLDARFRLEMYKTFVESKILQWRDDGGDLFIALNAAIDAYLTIPESERVQAYIDCAIALKSKIQPDGNNWNTANFLQLKKRADYEQQLINLLRLGVVTDIKHLLSLIEKI